MFNKLSIIFFTVAILVGSSSAVFAAVAYSNTGSFDVTVNNSAVQMTASSGVTLSVNINSTVANSSTAATVAAGHGRGNINYGMDSDGGGMYFATKAAGASATATPASTVTTNNFAAPWSAVP